MSLLARFCLVLLLGFVTLSGALAAAPGFPLLLTVGPASDPFCTHQTIQDALEFAKAQGPALDVIQVRTDHSPADAHFEVDGHSIFIAGGYATCGSSTASGRTVLDGTGGIARSVVEIRALTSGSRDVTLRGLEIRGGGNDANLTGGGIDIVAAGGASLEVFLLDLVVENNESTIGGGVAVNGALSSSVEVTIDEGSRISINQASAGGGLHCLGAAVYFLDGLIGPSNTAILGGGAFVDSNCLLRVEAGGVLQGITLNQATADGGGIFAQAGGDVWLRGSASRHADLVGNQAGGNGGGLFLASSSSNLLATGGNIASNSADGDGGGVYAVDGAGITMRRADAGECHDPIRCSRLSGNFAFGLGGALYLGDGASADIYQTYIEENGGAVRVAYVDGADSTLDLEGDVIAGHVGGNLFQVGIGSEITAAFSTFTANPSTSWIFLLGDQSTLRLYNSIFWEDQGSVIVVGGLTDITASCLISHESASLPAGSVVHLGDPILVDPEAGDYHIMALSRAIDSCDTSLYVPLEDDIDGDPRGTDFAIVPNAFPGSLWDIGADEITIPAATNVFADGFETGNTSLWTASVP